LMRLVPGLIQRSVRAACGEFTSYLVGVAKNRGLPKVAGLNGQVVAYLGARRG
jgi:hypothetical protein